MRLVLIFPTLLILSCLVGVSQPSLIKGIIQLVVMYIELVLHNMGTINLLNEWSTNFSSAGVLEGVVGVQKLTISGLGGLIVKQNNIDYNFDATNSVFSFCANLSVPNNTRLEIEGYDVDMAVFDELPLYGSGNLMLGFQDIDLALCGAVNLKSSIQFTDLLIKPGIKGLEFHLTGFWNNSQLSEAITKVIGTLEGVIMLFWNSEINCITCILSISLEHALNDLLHPNTPLKDFYQMAELTKSDCKDDCGLSNYKLQGKIFKTNALDLLSLLSNGEVVKEVVFGMSEYLNHYLEHN